MIHLDINSLTINSEDHLETNPEVRKDKRFKNELGHGAPEGTSNEDLFLACHSFRETYKQPAIFDLSNSRATTDSAHVPDKSKWNAAQLYAIEQSKGKYAFVEVLDSEALELRIESLNSLSWGDAIQEVLRSKLKEHYVENTTDDDTRYFAPPEIQEALYCAVRKVTLYFFRRVV